MKHTKHFVFLLTFLLASQYALYSQCAIQGSLADTLKTPIPFNPVGLMNYSDSAIVKGVISDAEGKFCFEGVRKGSYRISVTAIGFSTFYSEQINYDSTETVILPVARLQPNGINLNEVFVAAQKKTVEFKNGNVIVNVEGTALAMGNTAYDLLSRLPGVTVSGDNISIQGKTGVKILIDGKLQQLSGQQLMNVLKSMNASQIEKIEVLKKPPVKYDSEGTGGMINIKTNKLKLVGFSGSVFGSYSQGFYGNPSGGFTLNYKGRRVNFFSGFTAAKEWKHVVEEFTNKYNHNSTETTLQSTFINKEHHHSETYNLGADWFINRSNSVGIKMNGAFGMGNQSQIALSNFSDTILGYQNLNLKSQKPNPWIYPEFNINAEHLFDTTGTVLHFSANYNPYWDIYAANFENHYLDADHRDVTTPNIFKTSNTLTFNNSWAILDFEKEFKKELKFEAGLKHSYQEMQSDYYLQNQDYNTGEYTADTAYTNVFNYTQNISAIYLNFNKQYKKLSFQAGVRGENTIIHTLSENSGLGFDRQYFNLFPLASIDYKRNDDHAFSVSYNKRVHRPDYNSFNPFVTFISTQTSQKGNPFLKPEYAHDIGLNYSYKTWLNQGANFTRLINTFMGYTEQNDSTRSYVRSATNLNYTDVYAYGVFVQKDLFKWWSFNFGSTIFNINSNGVVNGLPFKYSTTGVSCDLFSRMTLPKGYSVEVSGFYLSPFLEGIYDVKARSSVNVAIKKTFLHDKLSASIAFNDIFWGQVRNATTNYQNQYMVGRQTYDTRRVIISLHYNFGKLKVEQRQAKDIEPQGKGGK